MVGFGLLLDLAYTYVHVFPLMAKRPNVRLLGGYVLMVLVDWYNSFLQKQMPAGSVQDSTDVWSFLHFVFGLPKHVFGLLLHFVFALSKHVFDLLKHVFGLLRHVPWFVCTTSACLYEILRDTCVT